MTDDQFKGYHPTVELRFRVVKEDDGTNVKFHRILQQKWISDLALRATGQMLPHKWRDVPLVLPEHE